MSRTKRLKKLVAVQEKLKTLHEERHAAHLAGAARAAEEAADLGRRFDASDSVGSLFPDLYHRRIDDAHRREAENHHKAREEAGRVLAATLRAGRVEDAWRAAARIDEREQGDRERLEIIERGLARRK